MWTHDDNETFIKEITNALQRNLPMSEIESARKDKIESYCKKHYNCTFDQKRTSNALLRIGEVLLEKNSSQDDILKAYKYDCYDITCVYHFVKNALGISYKEFSNIFKEETAMQQKNEAVVLNYILANAANYIKVRVLADDCGITVSETEKAIKNLRDNGIHIISRPGQKHGYTIKVKPEEEAFSESWINKVRAGLGLAPNFKYK